jgi:symplekin
MPAVRDFLQQLVESGPDWCTLGLLAARDVILNRPPNRSDLLQLVLDACCSPISDTRSKAVRLVANRLFPDPGMAHQIEQAARQRLDAMLPSTTPAAAAELVAVKAEQPSPEETQATLPASPSAQAAAAQRKGESADAGSSEQQPSQTAQDGAQQVEQPQRIGEDGTEVQAAGPSDTDAAQLCALYCALCTKKHSLLRHLFEVYAQTSGK